MSLSAERRLPWLPVLGAVAMGLVLLAGFVIPRPRLAPDVSGQRSHTDAQARTPRIRHVFVVNLENKGFDETWGKHSGAPYLAKACVRRACS